MHDRFTFEVGGIVDEVARGKVIGTIENKVTAGDKLTGIRRRETVINSNDINVGRERFKGLPRRIGLRHSLTLRAVQNLPLQVAEIDLVIIDDHQPPDTGCGKVESGG